MKIHSDNLTRTDIQAAAPTGVYVELAQQGSRSHRAAFTVYLSTDHGTRRPNSGGGSERQSLGTYAAAWDEWGIFLASLFAQDPNMVVGTVKRPIYASQDDFEWQTGERFEAEGTGIVDGEPIHNHRWDFCYPGQQTCAGDECSAVRRWNYRVT